jgi:formylglycine-generating enzyme required for sulfatase activity
VTDTTATAAVAWYIDDSGFTTHDAGLKLPNASGLYDMSGNVSEFCWDWFGSYPASPQADYRGPATDTIRVIAGGGYYDTGSSMAAASKGTTNPWQGSSSTGFRIAGANP